MSKLKWPEKNMTVCLQLVKTKTLISLYLPECPEYNKSHNVCSGGDMGDRLSIHCC